MVRATLTYTGPTSAPKSVVVKYPTDDPGSCRVMSISAWFTSGALRISPTATDGFGKRTGVAVVDGVVFDMRALSK
jgi:hypothetical protein